MLISLTDEADEDDHSSASIVFITPTGIRGE